MTFTNADMADILAATGEAVVVSLSGVTVKTIQVKFRTDFQALSPYEDTVDTYKPSFLCDPADIADVLTGHVFTARGIDYIINGTPQDLTSGFTRVILAKN
jgi:hypothetical protein